MNARDQLLTKIGQLKEWHAKYTFVKRSFSLTVGEHELEDGSGSIGINEYKVTIKLPNGNLLDRVIDLTWNSIDEETYAGVNSIVEQTILIVSTIRDSEDILLLRLIEKVDNVIVQIQFIVYAKYAQYFEKIKQKWFQGTPYLELGNI